MKTKNIPAGSIIAWVRTFHVLITANGNTMVTIRDGKVETFNNVDPEYEWCTKPWDDANHRHCGNSGHIIVAAKV